MRTPQRIEGKNIGVCPVLFAMGTSEDVLRFVNDGKIPVKVLIDGHNNVLLFKYITFSPPGNKIVTILWANNKSKK
jgi:hypothetical protein